VALLQANKEQPLPSAYFKQTKNNFSLSAKVYLHLRLLPSNPLLPQAINSKMSERYSWTVDDTRKLFESINAVKDKNIPPTSGSIYTEFKRLIPQSLLTQKQVTNKIGQLLDKGKFPSKNSIGPRTSITNDCRNATMLENEIETSLRRSTSQTAPTRLA
jgi:hypothetical protein